MPALGEALLDSAPDALKNANRMLDHFKSTLDVDVCYLMDARGMTISSSNRNDPDSFVGKNFIFRPYFQKAIRGNSATYLALGTTSGKRGAYHSYPVYGSNLGQPIGIVVIKVSIEEIERALGLDWRQRMPIMWWIGPETNIFPIKWILRIFRAGS